MGTFSVIIEVGGLEGQNSKRMEALVDTGATYLVVPKSLLESLGIRATEQRPFTMADDPKVDYAVGYAMLRLEGRQHSVLTVFGDEGTHALLGAVPLETFGFAVDPVNKRLVPVPGLLMPFEDRPLAGPRTISRDAGGKAAA